MPILILEHQEGGGAGRLGDVFRARGDQLEICRIFAGDAVPLPGELKHYAAVITLGGSMNVAETAEYPWIKDELALLQAAHERELPVVGVCLGCQLLAVALGGEVGPLAEDSPLNPAGLEIGWHEIRLTFPGTVEALYSGLPWKQQQFHWHGCAVKKLPPGALPLASSPRCKIQAFKAGVRSFGFQYHFELSREHILECAQKWSDQRQAVNLTLAELLTATAHWYEEYARLSTRLCNSIADYLIPVIVD